MSFGFHPKHARVARYLATFLIVAASAARPAFAVLIIGPNDANGNSTGGRNLSAPTGALTGSGWDLEGTWQTNFTGVPIAPNYFITAHHLGGLTGDAFVIGGVTYQTTAGFAAPDGSDLTIWRVNGTFSNYATINTASSALNQPLVVFGRSGGDGPMTAPDGSTHLNGWQWSGTLNGELSWGTNVVAFQGPLNGLNGQFLGFAFDKTLGPNTGAIASGDSGGGVFIQNNGVWTLAGINSVSTGPYNTLPGNAPATSFNASLFDSRGLYFDGTTQLITGNSAVPSVSFATSLSAEAAWITTVTGVPEPPALILFASGLALAWPRARHMLSNNKRVDKLA